MTTAEILKRAGDLKWPMAVADGGLVQTEAQWRRVAELPGNRAGLAAQLDKLEAYASQRADRKIAEDADDAQRAEAGTYDPDLAEEARAEAAADLARYVAERPARIEEKLDAIVSSLRAIADGLARR